MRRLQRGLIVVSFAVVSGWQLHLFPRNLSIGNLAQEMRDTVQPGLLLIIRTNDEPGGMLAVGCLEHGVTRH